MSDLEENFEQSFESSQSEQYDDQFNQNIKLNVNDLSFCQRVLKEMYSNKLHCDVTLMAGIDLECITAHRCVLAGASEYFSAMFNTDMKEKTQKKIDIKDVTGDTLKAMINYCYSGQIQINSENALDILESASLMRFEKVERKCQWFYEMQLRENHDLWLQVYEIAEKFSFDDLAERIVRIVCKDLRKIVESDEFYQMDFTLLQKILSSNEIYDVTEEFVFEAAMKWIKFDADEREPHIPDVLRLIRITEIDGTYLIKNIIPICKKADNSELLLKTLQWHVLPDSERKELLPIEQTTKRTWPSKIQVIGGTYDVDATSIEYYCYRSKNWELDVKIPLNHRKVERNFVVMNDNVYVLNGCERDLGPIVGSNDLHCLSLRSRKITKLASMSTNRAYYSVATANGFLFVAGGVNATYLNTMERYDPNLNVWLACTQMPNSRAHFGIAILDEYLYVIGGFNGNGYMEQVERYHLTKYTFTAVNSMNAKRANAGIGVLNGNIYAIGGENNSSNDLQSVEFYDPTSNKWTLIASLITPRSGISVAVYENQLFAIGGATGSIRSDLVECYSKEKDEWIQMESLNYPRFKCGVMISK